MVKHRNMILQVVLMLVTVGFYAVYWFYQTAKELKALSGDSTANPALWTVLLFVPLGCIYSYYMYGALFEKVSEDKLPKWVLFILWIFFPPGVWFLVQMDLNKRATAQV